MTSVYVVPSPVQPFASVARTTIGKDPVCAGVPERRPADDRVRPVGSVPLKSANVVVPTPPLWLKVWLKATFTVPVVVAGFVTVMTGQVRHNVYVGPVPVQPFESVTVTTIGKQPFCVGVPCNVPSESRIKPVGSVEAVVKVAVPMAPLCVKLNEIGVPAGLLVVAGGFTVMVW